MESESHGTCARVLGGVQEMGKDCTVMGDLVLTEDEINPVMAKLEQGGNRDYGRSQSTCSDETPRVMYMHIGAVGQPEKLLNPSIRRLY